MTEDDQSFLTNPAVPSEVPSGGDGNGNAGEDAFVRLLVQKFEKNIQDPNKVQRTLATLVDMDLHLPENADARESISGTNIVECLVKCMSACKAIMTPVAFGGYQQTPKQQTFSLSVELMQHLISGGHTKNITACYQCGALPLLVEGMQGSLGTSYDVPNQCASVLKLLRTDENPSEGEECLLDFSCITAIVRAMANRQDTHEWGCSSLKYILEGWETHIPSKITKPLSPIDAKQYPDDVGEAFLQTGAIDAILRSLVAPQNCATSGLFGTSTGSSNINRNNPTSESICQASICLQILARKSPAIRSTLVEKGAVALLGAAMQLWPQEAINVQGPAQRAILDIFGTP